MRLFVALVTPFDGKGKLDLPRLRSHVTWLLQQGVDGFFVTGTTGEFPYLGSREREAVQRTVIDASAGHPVYVCPWDASPTTTAYLADAATEQGAAGVFVPPPLFYRLDERELEAAYRDLAERCGVPILGYHHPRRLPTDISTTLYARLRADNVLAGLKDSSMDLFRLSRLAAADPNAIFAGGDRMLAQIARIPRLAGFVTAIGNVWPRLCIRLLKERETQLEEVLVDRVVRIRRAGGPRALKALLEMGCRAPLVRPPPAALEGLPGPEQPV